LEFRRVLFRSCAHSAFPTVTSAAIRQRVTKSSKPRSDKTSPFSSAPARDDGELRIIGGRWRGRKLRFPSLPGLRPSPDRVRETLFNWLAPELPGARSLDLFAGSEIGRAHV